MRRCNLREQLSLQRETIFPASSQNQLVSYKGHVWDVALLACSKSGVARSRMLQLKSRHAARFKPWMFFPGQLWHLGAPRPKLVTI